MLTRKHDFRPARVIVAVLCVASALIGAAPSQAVLPCDARVTFDLLTAGDIYGGPSYPPGALLFSEDGIDVHSARFERPDGSFKYGEGRVDYEVGAPVFFGRNLIFRPENFGLTFDLTNLNIDVALVRFQWLDNGGTENLRVNGAPNYIGEIKDAPIFIAPGIKCIVNHTVIGYDEKGVVVLKGPVRRFTVAGQEFAIDNVCVIGTSKLTFEPVAVTVGGDELETLTVKARQAEETSWGALKAQFR